jgi:glycosyltransferase involved in cell wall biosynthesis
MMTVEPSIRLVAFVTADAPDSTFRAPWAGEVEWVRFSFAPSRPGPLPALVSMAAQWGALPVLAARRRLDVVHGLANIVPLWAPRVSTVVTLLDLIWIRHPTTMPLRGTAGMRLAAPTSARAADRVIAISEAARQDFVTTLGLEPSKIDVTHLGVRLDDTVVPTPAAELRRRLELGDGPLILYVGQVRRHKNPDGLIAALAAQPHRDAHLVFAGQRSEVEDHLRARASELGISERVHFTGWVSDEDLEGLYRAAACFVLPSFEEGFGLPVLEAMARRVPVACSDIASLSEVAGDAAELFDPHDPTDIARALEAVLGDSALRAELVEQGSRRAQRFSWEATARETLGTYRRAMAARRR